jgi:hypothetical protein
MAAVGVVFATLIALYDWLAVGLPLRIAAFGAVLIVLCIGAAPYAVRCLYLPIQFVRHRVAVRKVERAEAELIPAAGAGDPQAKSRLSVRPGRPDPREVPWWHW